VVRPTGQAIRTLGWLVCHHHHHHLLLLLLQIACGVLDANRPSSQAYTDISTGDAVKLNVVQVSALRDLITIISPREIVFPQSSTVPLASLIDDLKDAGTFVSLTPDVPVLETRNNSHLGLLETSALACLKQHVQATLMPKGEAFKSVAKKDRSGLKMDANTVSSLEVVKGRNTGTREGNIYCFYAHSLFAKS